MSLLILGVGTPLQCSISIPTCTIPAMKKVVRECHAFDGIFCILQQNIAFFFFLFSLLLPLHPLPSLLTSPKDLLPHQLSLQTKVSDCNI